MLGFLIDEDLPRSLSRQLQESGVMAVDVRDVGLRGESDRAILEYAVSRKLALLTGDLGFSNILEFPPRSHSGIVVARFPAEITAKLLTQGILDGLRGLPYDEIDGALVIIEPGRIRLRRRG